MNNNDEYMDEFDAWNSFADLEHLDNDELKSLIKQYLDDISREELVSTVQYLRVMRFEHEPL